MQKITPCLWFNLNGDEAVNYYTSIFANSKILGVTHVGDSGSLVTGNAKGSVLTVRFQLDGVEFLALNGGPAYEKTPAISLFVNCGTVQEIDTLFKFLSKDGTVMMDLSRYPFSEKFAWVTDRFGVSWQLNMSNGAQKIVPFLMFTGDQHGKAEEAVNYYTSIFAGSRIDDVVLYEVGDHEPGGTLKRARFNLSGMEFMAIDSDAMHAFTFTPGMSLIVNCQTQSEVDVMSDRLTDGGTMVKCGWVTDRFGLSWQIVPTILGEMLLNQAKGNTEQLFQAMLTMDKLDIETLKKAYHNSPVA